MSSGKGDPALPEAVGKGLASTSFPPGLTGQPGTSSLIGFKSLFFVSRKKYLFLRTAGKSRHNPSFPLNLASSPWCCRAAIPVKSPAKWQPACCHHPPIPAGTGRWGGGPQRVQGLSPVGILVTTHTRIPGTPRCGPEPPRTSRQRRGVRVPVTVRGRLCAQLRAQTRAWLPCTIPGRWRKPARPQMPTEEKPLLLKPCILRPVSPHVIEDKQ